MITRAKVKKSRSQYPWEKWLKGTAKKPTVLTFGKEIPADKKPAVLTAQLHEWAKALDIWAYTSVDHDKKYLRVYGIPAVKGQERPPSIFPSPKKGTHQNGASTDMAKKKAASKNDKSTDCKPSKKKAAKKKKGT